MAGQEHRANDWLLDGASWPPALRGAEVLAGWVCVEFTVLASFPLLGVYMVGFDCEHLHFGEGKSGLEISLTPPPQRGSKGQRVISALQEAGSAARL